MFCREGLNVHNKITYLTEIVEAIKELDGMGALKEITDVIERRDKLSSIHTNVHWKNNVSAEIQRHCNITKSYKGRENIFYSVYGLGEGYWGLISMKDPHEENKNNPIIKRQIDNIKNHTDIADTQKNMIIKARVGQGVFRDRIIEKYKHCIITGIDDTRLLVASHIKPWRSSNNYERLDAENGLLLSPLYDRLFDIGLITFDESMNMLISSQLSKDNRQRMRLDDIHVNTKDIKISSAFITNMKYHRDKIFKE